MKKYITIIVLLVSNILNAQSNPDYGFADTSVAELSQFEYYRGVWNSQIELRQPDGSFKMLSTGATIKGWYLGDHLTFQTLFTTPKGGFSTDIRTFNIDTKEWRSYFIDAKQQQWSEIIFKVVDGKMTSFVKGGYGGKEKFDVKTVDTKISQSQYQKDIYHSYDQMKTWKHVYKMLFSKAF